MFSYLASTGFVKVQVLKLSPACHIWKLSSTYNLIMCLLTTITKHRMLWFVTHLKIKYFRNRYTCTHTVVVKKAQKHWNKDRGARGDCSSRFLINSRTKKGTSTNNWDTIPCQIWRVLNYWLDLLFLWEVQNECSQFYCIIAQNIWQVSQFLCCRSS